MSLGGNSPARQLMPRTSMPRVCGVLCLRPPKSVLRNGAAPRTAPVVSPLQLEAPHKRKLMMDVPLIVTVECLAFAYLTPTRDRISPIRTGRHATTLVPRRLRSAVAGEQASG